MWVFGHGVKINTRLDEMCQPQKFCYILWFVNCQTGNCLTNSVMCVLQLCGICSIQLHPDMFSIGLVFSKYSNMVPIWMSLIPLIEPQTVSPLIMYIGQAMCYTKDGTTIQWFIHIWYSWGGIGLLLLHCPHFMLLWSAVPAAWCI